MELADNIKHSNYKIAGKTGTAKKVVNGRYVNRYYTSFAGFFHLKIQNIVVLL